MIETILISKALEIKANYFGAKRLSNKGSIYYLGSKVHILLTKKLLRN